VTRLLEGIGRLFLRVLEELGLFFEMMGRFAIWTVRPPYDLPELLRQMVRVGVDSVPVCFLTTLFTGMVMALQTFNGFQRFHAESFVGSVVALSLTRELSPVLTAFMVTGRVGSAMAAELGTMRVTEQIDAMTALGTEPVQYLVVPRVAASILMMPPLVVMGDAVGMFGGYFVAVKLMGANPVTYVENSFQFLKVGDDIVSGLIKAAAFGFVFSLIACVRGYHTTGGAEGVGRSTTRAVVAGSLSILLVDFFLTKLLY
jgi:phospholipid/cholesterol/gamma-HCH transport system permease protein